YSTGAAALFAWVTALASGCSGDGAADPNDATPTGGTRPSTTVTDATVTGTGGASAGPTQGTDTTSPMRCNCTTTGGGGDPPDPSICIPGVPATSQIPRLKNVQYDNIVRDILGVTTLASGLRPSQMLNTDSTGAMNTFMWDAYQNAARTIAAEVMT